MDSASANEIRGRLTALLKGSSQFPSEIVELLVANGYRDVDIRHVIWDGIDDGSLVMGRDRKLTLGNGQ